MNKAGPVIVIEDDPDDQEVLVEIFKMLNYENEIKFFFDGEAALEYIHQQDVIPFLILSDVNMPRLNGFELKQRIATNAELQAKCIPFLFFTTSASKQAVIDAYSASAQGFFMKQGKIHELKETISVIMNYWQRCYSPNQYALQEGQI